MSKRIEYPSLQLDKNDYIWITAICCAAFVIFLSVSLYFNHGINPVFDANWYKFIAESGYIFNGNYHVGQNVAFLPLYPKLVSLLLGFLPLKTGWVMLTVSSIATFLSAVLFYDLIKRYFDSGIALRTVSLYLLGPFSLYQLNGYSEGLFLFLAVLMLHLLTVSRAYHSAAVVVALASIDRQYGIFLSLIVIFTYIIEKKHQPEKLLDITSAENIYLLGFICGSGLMIFTFYQFLCFGDPLLFVHILGAWGFANHRLSFVQMLMGRGILPGVVVFFKEGLLFNPVGVGVILFITMIVMSFIYMKKLPRLMSAYVFVIGVPMYFISIGVSEGSYINSGRYSLILFPGWLAVVLCIRDIFRRNQKKRIETSISLDGQKAANIRAINGADMFYWLILCVSVVLLIIYTARFVQGQWVS